jgi:hypothetical protein
VQYVTFFPSSEENETEVKSRLDAVYIRVQTSEHQPILTELGEKILGSRRYSTGEKVHYEW